MELATIANVLGFACLAAAAFMVTQVESAQLGTYSSRFVATVLAISAYYGATSIGGIDLGSPVAKFAFLRYLVPALGVVGLVYFGWKVYENWSTETKSVMRSGWKLLLIVALALLARFLLSQ